MDPKNTTAKPLSDSGLMSPAFQGLLWTQWLTAVNDNVFRWFVIGVGKDQFTPENVGTLLVVGSSFFIVPYILFAPLAGWLANRYKKSHVILGCKIAEIVIMTIGVIAVWLMGTPDPTTPVDPFFVLLLITVFFMGMQSALFAPAKVGTIPELLNEKNIAAGNGIFNLATLSATVIGMALGGKLSDLTNRGQDNVLLAASVLIGIAVIGTIISFWVRSLPAADPKAKLSHGPKWMLPIAMVTEGFKDIVNLIKFRVLFRVALGIAFFWAIAAFAQLNIDVFSEESGGLSESDRTPLLIAVTLGIGLGSVLAGIISRGRIELGLVPIGAIGLAVFSFLLWLSPADFINENAFDSGKILVCLLLCGLGMSAGIFDVPLASYLQHNSPIETRGSILSATNCLAFSGILGMFGLLLFCSAPTKEGSLENLPVQLTANSLEPAQRQKLELIMADYRQASLVKGVSNLKPLVERAEGFEDVAITELGYADARRRRDENLQLTFDQYLSEFKAPVPEGANANDPNSELAVNESNRQSRLLKKAILQGGKQPRMSSRQIFLLMGVITVPVILYSLSRLARPFVRLLFYLFVCTLYKVRVSGEENLPKEGGAIVVGNHSSWLDGFILLILVPRIPRAIAWAGNFKGWFLEKWAAFCGVILIAGGPKSIRRGLDTAAQAIKDGSVVGVFPEGGISQECQVKTFKPGLQKILKSAPETPVIPIYFDELWGSIFSYSEGKSIFKFPKSIRRPLSVHIGKPIENTDSMFSIRQGVTELGAQTVENYSGKFVAAPAAFIDSCKKAKFRTKVADSTNQEETGGKLLTRALVLRKLLRKHVLKADETNVAVLIPPTVGGAIVNVALALDKRVAINLNYSLSNELINHCIKDAGVNTVLTTRKVADKFNFEFDCNVFYLDDLKDKVSGVDKAVAAFQAFAVPGGILKSMLGLGAIKPDDLLTIVFTSGSTGVPKGVMLTQQNVMSNVDGIEKVASLRPSDTLIGVLPFFHSMGYTVTLWVPMTRAIAGVYHFNPLDSKIIGKITKKYSGTIIVATPTFLRSYMRRCTPEEFASLDMAIAGAERLPPEMCDEFEKKFGVRPVEGYGTTELAPVACVNIPYSRQSGKKFQVDAKEGTVGRPMPNVAVKVTDLDTGEKLGPNESGMLWVTGPNVMKGYLNRPDATQDVLVDGWYKTGDVALIDEDGFVKITGRMSRFSKIGGEMVPHLKIEEVLSRFLDETPDDDSDDQLQVAVTAVPDTKKGERLIVLHTKVGKTAEEMQQALKDAELPNIFIPAADGFIEVESLPILGTGKLDLRGLKDMALEKTGS